MMEWEKIIGIAHLFYHIHFKATYIYNFWYEFGISDLRQPAGNDAP